MKTRSNASITANTIIAQKMLIFHLLLLLHQPNSPTTNARAIANITVIIPKHLLLLHLSSFCHSKILLVAP